MSRSRFNCSSRLTCAARTASLSISSTGISGSSGAGYAFTPTITSRPGVDARLPARRRLFDAHLGQAGLDRLRHAAQSLNLLDQVPRRMHQLVRQPLHIVGSGPRIDHARDARLLLQVKLRVARDARGKIRGQRQRFVQRVGVQRLRAARRPRPAPQRTCAPRCYTDPAP